MPSSPWWYEQSHEFVYKFLSDKNDNDNKDIYGIIFSAHLVVQALPDLDSSDDDNFTAKIDIKQTTEFIVLEASHVGE